MTTCQGALTLTSAKTPLYCHSQHRNLAPLRRLEPDPVAEISPLTAAARDIGDGDWLAITTPRGRVRARARLNASLADGIVAALHGWPRMLLNTLSHRLRRTTAPHVKLH